MSKGRKWLLAAGREVDHYRIVRPLGRGGMAEVYLARDTLLGRKVALKVLHPERFSSPRGVERFLFEARATARFNHPHIVTIHGVGQDDEGRPYVALEFLEGQTLQERMQESSPGVWESIRYGAAIAEALVEAHGEGILHRDLKPDNVILPRDGRLRVLDFGLAKAVPESVEPRTLQPDDPEAIPTIRLDEPFSTEDGGRMPKVEGLDSQVATRAVGPPPDGESSSGPLTEGICGTPAYMAPEQWRGISLGPGVDSWGLGLLLYELLSGRLPYGEGRGRGHARRVCSPEPVPALEPRETVPSRVLDLVQRCLEKEPTRRPSAAEILEILQEALSEGDRAGTAAVLKPFRGLFPFDERHRRSFFGREAEIEEFVERLRIQPVIAVVGPSGAGKSSFVRAGVVPRLRERGPLIVLTLRPGRQPFRALAARILECERGADSVDTESPFGTGTGLSTAGTLEGSRETGQDDPEAVKELVQKLESSPGATNLRLHALAEERRSSVLVVVDQLEELYALVPTAELRRLFMSSLCHAADDAEAPVRVVLTLREEFLSRLAEGPEVREALGHVTVLRNPDREMLEEVLSRPVEAAGYRYDDPVLVKQMVEEVVASPACLPLVQFAGQMLWQGRNEGRRELCRSRYDEMGGVAGALARHADGVLAGLSDSEVETARRLLLRLVTPEGTRSAMARGDVLEGLGREAAAVMDRLVEARLVVARRSEKAGQGELELIHESLIANWSRLSRWIDESREERVILFEMTQAAELWQRRGHRDEEVWTGDALREAQRTVARQREQGQDPPALVTRFLEQGRRKETRSVRRRRVLAVGLVMVLSVVVAVLAVLNQEANRQRARAEQRQLEAERRHAESLREGARAALAQGDLLEARAKVRGSLEIEDSMPARVLWWRLEGRPLLWRDGLGIEHHQVALSLDGGMVATSASAQSVQVFDARDSSVKLLAGHDDATLGIAISPDNKLVAAGCFGGDISLWDLPSGARWTLSGHEEVVWSLDFTRDGKTLVSGSYDGRVRFWDVETREAGIILDCNRGPVRRVRVSPDGSRLAVGTRGGFLQLRSLPRGNLLWEGQAPEEVLALAFFPDGRRIVTGGNPGDKIRLWDAEMGELLEELETGHESAIESLDVSADGQMLATGSRDRTLRIRFPESETEERVIPWGGEIHVLRFSPDGSYLAVTSDDDALRLWSPEIEDRREPVAGHQGLVWGVSFHPRGHLLASGASDGTVRIWDVGSGEVVKVLQGHDTTVHGVAFSPGGDLLVSGSSDGTARIWDVAQGKTLMVLRGHERPVPAVAFSADGRHVVTGGVDHLIRVWAGETGSLVSTLAGHTGPILDLAMTSAGDKMASVGYDGTVRLWSTSSWAPLDVLRATEGYAYGVAFSPDGSLVAASCHDGSVRLWDLQEGRDRVLGSFQAIPYMLRFSPDGRWLVVPLQNGEIRVLSLVDDESWGFSGHRDAAQTVAFDAPGGNLATAGHDGTLRLWDAASGRPRWHGKGLIRSADVLATHRGYVDLSALPEQRAIPSWLPPVDELAFLAESEDGLVCSATWDGPLQVREGLEGGVGLQLPSSSVAQLLAIPSACVVRSEDGQVSLLGPSLGVRQLDVENARWAGWDGEHLSVVAGDEIRFYDGQGAFLESLPGDSRITAALRMGTGLVTGYALGLVEMAPVDPGTRLVFEGTPQSSATVMLSGPGGTVGVGFADGTVGLWDPATGQVLARARLHGPVSGIWLQKGRVVAVTELGDWLAWDLRPIETPRCDLLQAVWKRVPVTWQQGRARLASPPESHTCR